MLPMIFLWFDHNEAFCLLKEVAFVVSTEESFLKMKIKSQEQFHIPNLSLKKTHPQTCMFNEKLLALWESLIKFKTTPLGYTCQRLQGMGIYTYEALWPAWLSKRKSESLRRSQPIPNCA